MIVYRLCNIGEAEEILQKKSMTSVGKCGKDLYNIQQHKNVSNHTT